MLTCKSLLVGCGAVLLGLTIVASSHAWNGIPQYLTFSGPVALPGVTLAGGTYVFERLNSDPRLVRVSSRDSGDVYVTAFTRLIKRPVGLPRDRQVMLGESPAGTAPPIKAWFPIGASQGHEFIYAAH